MSRRILTTLLAVAYAAIVLPGHAGLHALSGIEHCQHGSLANDALSSSDSASTTVSCSDHHHHHDDAQQHESSSGSKSPENFPHDHGGDSDCEICQWFSQGQVLIESASIEVADSLITAQSAFKVNPFEKSVFSNADPRGPPAVC